MVWGFPLQQQPADIRVQPSNFCRKITFNLEFNTQVNYHSNTKEEKASSDSLVLNKISDELFPGSHQNIKHGVPEFSFNRGRGTERIPIRNEEKSQDGN